MPLQASKEELDSVLDGPAIYSNKFFVSMSGAIRISFCEQLPDLLPRFRAAIAMSHQDAIELKNLLQDMLAPIEEQLANVQRISPLNDSKEK